MAETKQAEEHKIEPKAAPSEQQLNSLSVDASQLIELMAKELRSIPQIKPPAWAPFVKTGAHKERPPSRNDWWYVRAAAVLRTVARLGPVGTSKLRTKFGGKHSRGFKSERFARGSGSIIRKAMQQLEKAGLIRQAAKGVHKGRVITEKASAMMSSIALKVKAAPAKSRTAMPEAKEPKAAK
ncbi:30S ribosomal protein S19e [Candidatus Woesearchaeota archaeon]|nr:30S ribosomal protein S19e [Candidatus Woesearchaeota archaeon]